MNDQRDAHARQAQPCDSSDSPISSAAVPYPNNTNDKGCPLYNQTGDVAVKHFALLIARLPPELRVAYERERRACRRGAPAD